MSIFGIILIAFRASAGEEAAGVNHRPASSKGMSSGSPDATLLELEEARVNSQRAVGALLRPDLTSRWSSRPPLGHSASRRMEFQ